MQIIYIDASRHKTSELGFKFSINQVMRFQPFRLNFRYWYAVSVSL